MSDYKQTRDAAGNVTSQYSQMLQNLNDDDMVNKLYDRRVCSQAQNSCRNDQILNQAADRLEELEANLSNMAGLWAKSDSEKQLLLGRIEELEAKLAKAVKTLRELIGHTHNCEKELTEELHNADFCGESLPLTSARSTLAELRSPMKG